MKPSYYLFISVLLIVSACGTFNGTRIKYQRTADTFTEEPQTKKVFAETAEISSDYSSPILEKVKTVEDHPVVQTLNETPAKQIECDTLLMNSGMIMSALIVEVDEKYIHTRKCEEPEGKIYKIDKNLVKEIRWANGEKTVTTIEADSLPQIQPERLHSAKMTFVFGLLSFIPIVGVAFAITAIIGGIISLRKIKKYPNRYHYSDKQKATNGIIFAGIGILISVLFFIWTVLNPITLLGSGSLLSGL